ncbi:MAG TPA: hypothetical protein PK971_10810 [Saprospiraceae bacterium]|nr:hypothetical protein [Saprospiraceae bacterium]
MSRPSFSWKKMGLVLGLTALVGVGAYAVAWQFNDGKITQRVVGAVFLAMALPNVIIGGTMRLFRPDLQRYFALMLGGCAFVGLLLKL